MFYVHYKYSVVVENNGRPARDCSSGVLLYKHTAGVFMCAVGSSVSFILAQDRENGVKRIYSTSCKALYRENVCERTKIGKECNSW